MSPASRRQPKNRSYQRRAVNVRPVLERFLIVCQGTETEPNYFNQFRVPGLVIQVTSVPRSPYRVVESAIHLRRESEIPYDQVWCVFDRDETTADEFNNAIQTAQVNHIQVAYSNEAFELWYLLHFDFVQTGISRNQYILKLGDKLGHPYDKNSAKTFKELLDRQGEALRNAAKLLQTYQPLRPHQDNPSTQVHLLVEQLNRFKRW
ncbi:MAG: RloB family protein [Anaerolineaceae bacterium]